MVYGFGGDLFISIYFSSEKAEIRVRRKYSLDAQALKRHFEV